MRAYRDAVETEHTTLTTGNYVEGMIFLDIDTPEGGAVIVLDRSGAEGLADDLARFIRDGAL